MPILKCESCGSEFRKTRGKFCSRDCYEKVSRKSDKEHKSTYRNTYAPRHPLSDGAGNIRTHRLVLFKKIGEGPHPCHWCGKAVEWIQVRGTSKNGLMVDHVNGNKMDNSPENLVPSCQRCNSRRGNHLLVEDDEVFVTDIRGIRHRAEEIVCRVCGTRFLARRAIIKYRGIPVCDRSCSRKGRSQVLG